MGTARSTAASLFFFKQKTAYEMRISDWSSDVCSSDLLGVALSHVRKRIVLRDVLDPLHPRIPGQHPPYLFRLLRSDVPVAAGPPGLAEVQIGRASCRERGCQYV